MNWEFISATTGTLALVLIIFLEWPRLKDRLSGYKINKVKFSSYLMTITLIGHALGVMTMTLALLFVRPFDFVFWWGWGSIVTGMSGIVSYGLGKRFWGILISLGMFLLGVLVIFKSYSGLAQISLIL